MNYLTDSIGLDTTFDQRFGDWGSGAGGSAPSGDMPQLTGVSPTVAKAAGTVVGGYFGGPAGAAAGSAAAGAITGSGSEKKEPSIGDYLIRGTVIILGFIFVAIGLTKFGGEGVGRVIRQASPL